MKNTLLQLTFSALAFSMLGQTTQAGDAIWRITRDTWTAADEKSYSEFVQAIGEAKCRTLESCLKSSANPFRNSDPPNFHVYADCSKTSFILRAYFAWKSGLPFSFVDEVNAIDTSGDLRYSPRGNRPARRHDVTTSANALDIISKVAEEVSTAMYRYPPNLDDPNLFTDMYPTEISRNGIRPGTVIYDPNGHVATVYRVEPDGRVLYFDTHPDNSLSHGTYGEAFARSSPGMGAGFKNFRPLKLIGYTKDANGVMLGGRVVAARNADIPLFSLVQFFGTNPSSNGKWSDGQFMIKGETVKYQDYVRRSLAIGELRYKPMEELSNMLKTFCDAIQDRAEAVQIAINHGIQNQSHPERLPNNIYGTDGDWESFSTPSRDAELKTSFKEAYDHVAEFLELQRTASPKIDYSGSDLRADLLAVYNEIAPTCQIQYKKSDGSMKTLTLREITQRLFKLSFDPYHCVELRWGETDPRDLEACRDNENKRAWYVQEQRLRNQIDRLYDARMDFSLSELPLRKPGSGVDAPPEVDILKLLNSR